jgi:membrane protein YdbS with pleckstrin-like domain
VAIGGDQGYAVPDEIKKASQATRLINLFRSVMYFSVAYVQFINLECLQPGSTVPCDTMLVYVPLFLGLLDSVMVLWSTRTMTRRFWQVAFLVAVLAIFISMNSLTPIFQSRTPYTSLQTAMIVLGSLVFVVSVIELLLYRNKLIEKKFSFQVSPREIEIRTYVLNSAKF